MIKEVLIICRKKNQLSIQDIEPWSIIIVIASKISKKPNKQATTITIQQQKQENNKNNTNNTTHNKTTTHTTRTHTTRTVQELQNWNNNLCSMS